MGRGRPWTRTVTAACGAVGLAFASVGLAAPAWGIDLNIEMPASLSVTQRTEVPVAISSSEPICAVTADGPAEIAGQGPYVLTIDPSRFDPESLEDTVMVVVELCEGLSVYETIEVSTPFVVRTPTVIAPWGERTYERDLSIEVRSPESVPVEVQVLRDGAVVKDFGPVVGRQDLSFRIPKGKARGRWQIRSVSQGIERIQDLTVAYRWSTLLPGRLGLARFPACSTVTWSYDPKGAPRKVTGIERDIAGALARLATSTGLTFVQVPEGADLGIGWANFGARGPDGRGGGGLSTTQGRSTYQGYVALNTKSDWVRLEGFGRVARMGGLPGRGLLLLHEIGHALGLGHVDDEQQVMYPVASGRSPLKLAEGDLAGLKHLYDPAACPVAS